jgi:hypothetical protein
MVIVAAPLRPTDVAVDTASEMPAQLASELFADRIEMETVIVRSRRRVNCAGGRAWS